MTPSIDARGGWPMRAAWLAVAATACSTTYAATTDGVDAGAVPDAGEDAPAESGSGDDGGIIDADADAGPFCKRASYTFCEDFDEHPLGAGWDKVNASAGALSLDTVAPKTAPAALGVDNQLDAAVPSDQFLQTKIAGPFAHAVVEADVRIDAAPMDTSLTAAAISVAFVVPNGPNWHLALQHYANKISIVESYFAYADGGYGYVFHDVLAPFTLGTWTHVRIEVSAGAPSHGKVDVDGATVFDAPLTQSWQPTDVEITTGAFNQIEGLGHWRAHVDDVTLGATP